MGRRTNFASTDKSKNLESLLIPLAGEPDPAELISLCAMRVNIVSYSSSGGAGNVGRSLEEGFREIGCEPTFLVATDSNLRSKPFENPKLTFSAGLDHYFVRHPSWNSLVSYFRDRNGAIRNELPKADLTIFRWMNGLLGSSSLLRGGSFGALAWGLDDMNPFTGVCHYSGTCNKFQTGCNACPALRNPLRNLAERRLQDKVAFVEKYAPVFVAPTDWIADSFRSSLVGKVSQHVKISNPIQPIFFSPNLRMKGETNNSRTISILIVAANLEDPTKGLLWLLPSLKRISESPKFRLELVGRAGPKLKHSLPNALFSGPLSRQATADRMQSAHLLLVPSLFENAGTVVAEAASQGTASLAHNIGGMPEMTGYGNHGMLFESPEDLWDILQGVSIKELSQMGNQARSWAQGFKPKVIAQIYADEFLQRTRL